LKIKLLEYYISKNKLYAFLFSKDPSISKVAILPIDLGVLNLNTINLLSYIDGTSPFPPCENPDPDQWQPFSDEWGKELFEGFIEDLKDTDLLYIVPHRFLHKLPLHAVRIDGKYLCEMCKVCYAPSPSLLKRCQLQNKARMPNSKYEPNICLSIGCDNQSANPANRKQFCDYARGIGNMFSSKSILTEFCPLLEGEEAASVNRIEEKCLNMNPDLISFFCHGMFNRDNPLASLLSLPPKGLTALDIMTKIQIDASLVTLIACTSATPEIRSGDELYSLAMAMIFSGAASVTGSLWRAWVPAASIFFKKFISSWKSGIPKAAAFNEAQMELLHNTQFSHPHYWSPYILVGDWI